MSGGWLAALLAITLLLAACDVKRPPKAPGETDILVSSVTIKSHDGSDLVVAYGELFQLLGMRPKSLIFPPRYYSQFRENEDRRRVIAHWQLHGYFDVEVDDPLVEHDKDNNTVAITWTVKEGEQYRIAQVQLLHAPQDHEQALQDLINFGPTLECRDDDDCAEGVCHFGLCCEPGTKDNPQPICPTSKIHFEEFRYVRRDMMDHLRRVGFGHARVYTRVFVEKANKALHWYFYCDPGPKTKIGSLKVLGAVNVPPELVIERSGMVVGEDFTWNKRYDGEFHLLDTGAYSSSFIKTPKSDTTFFPPADRDTGGVMSDEQVDSEGNLIPRDLAENLDVEIHIREAPSQQLRMRAGAEFDPTRIDTALTSRLWLRNLFGPLHHLVLEGRIGYGWLWRSTTDDPTGLYGEALVRYLKPMWIARLLDFRMTARFRDELLPGYHMREFTAGPGIRFAIAPGRAKSWHNSGVFFDMDALFRWGQQVDFGPFDAATRDAFELAEDDRYTGGELQAGFVWDNRDNTLEAQSGHMLALRGSMSPGGTEHWNRYFTLAPEARGFIPLSKNLSIGMRGATAWVFGQSDEGVPLGPRLFGGGAYGMRGFGRNRLSPYAPTCRATPAGALQVCQGVPVGGMSLAEASLEGRFLPYRKQYGALLFSDLGGASVNANPFDNGLSLALGLGLRVRFWYLPMALDFSYRLLRDNELQEPEHDPFLVFFRLGEAF